MKPIGQRRGAADATGWLLGTIIVVLAVLDLMIWATLWNVPNPISKFLLPRAAAGEPSAAAAFGGVAPRPASLIAVRPAPAAALKEL